MVGRGVGGACGATGLFPVLVMRGGGGRGRGRREDGGVGLNRVRFPYGLRQYAGDIAGGRGRRVRRGHAHQ